MILSARPLAGSPGMLELWVGAFGVAPLPNPFPLPTFSIGGTTILPLGSPQWSGVRDKQRGSGGQPLNYFALFQLDLQHLLPPLDLGKPHTVRVRLLGVTVETTCKPLPTAVPDDGFTLLLSSCYYRTNDRGSLGVIAGRLQDPPDLVLLAGDQVYMDMPLFEDMPSVEPDISHMIGNKYAKHFLSREKDGIGLHPLLQLAPTACIPDDHELWNNYPLASPTMWGSFDSTENRLIRNAARAMYEDFQLGTPGKSGAQRIDVDPLHMLLIDTRFDRTSTGSPTGLFTQATADDLHAWKQRLLDAHRTGRLAIGVLACGQILFDEAPGFIGEFLDNNLHSYAQFGIVVAILRQLAAAGVPVLFLSGDVHYGRVTAATFQPTQHECLFEVISSPSSLLTPGVSDPARPPASFDANRFTTRLMKVYSGDMVATLKFARLGAGVQVTVTYYSFERGADRKANATCSFHMIPRFH